MNITINELLFDRKVKFGQGEAGQPTTQAPVPQTQTANAGMKALMFQGMKNLMANPALAEQVGGDKENAPVAPKEYSQNVSFGMNRRSFVRKIPALAASVLLAGTLATTSCKDEISQNQSVIVQMDNAIVEELKEISSKLDKLVAQGDATATFRNAYLNAMNEVKKLVEGGFAEQKNYATLVIQYMSKSETLQKEILAELKDQGLKDEQARKYYDKKVNDIIKLLNDSRIDLDEAVRILNSIDSKMSVVVGTLSTISTNIAAIRKDNAIYHQKDLMNGAINNQLLGIGNTQRAKQLENDEKMYNKILEMNTGINTLIQSGNENTDKLIDAVKQAVLSGEEIANRLGWTAHMDAQAILRTLTDFKNGQLAWDAKFYGLQVENNNLLKTYLPLLKNQTGDNSAVLAKLDDVIGAINRNTDVTQDDVKAQEDANRLLKELIEKADPFIENINKHLKNVENNWNIMLPLLRDFAKSNGDYQKAIKLLMDTYFPQFITALNGIKDNTDDLSNIGGSSSNPITLADLDQLLSKYTDKINDNNDTNTGIVSGWLEKIFNDMKNLDRNSDPDYTLWLEKIENAIKSLKRNEGVE